MNKLKKFPHYRQLDAMDCGPTCLRIVAKHYGKEFTTHSLRQKCQITKAGVSFSGIASAAEKIGFRSIPIMVKLWSDKHDDYSLNYAPLPCIVHWNQNHFVVLYKITSTHVYIADPGADRVKLTHAQFESSFCSNNNEGVALLLETTPDFYKDDESNKNESGLSYIYSYLTPHKKLLFQVLIGLLLGTLFQLIFPFLTQSLVDKGIETNDLNFIFLILIGQLVLVFSQTFVKFLQSWIILHISTRLNVSMVSDYLVKLMRLHIGYFDSRNTGDIMQRIGDHRRIESFMTNSILSTLLSTVNLVVFSIVLLTYNQLIFLIFSTAAVLYIAWILVFMAKRKEIDYVSFQHLSDNQDVLYEIVQGMQEIKLQGSHFRRRWKWTEIQAKILRVQMKSLALMQYQDAGGQLINNLKDIFITFIAAKAVIDGSLTLGMMLSIQYIIGQMTGPLQQLVNFMRSAQDASISLERIKETLDEKSEDDDEEHKISYTPQGDIILENLSFKYSELPDAPYVLKNINCKIQRGKTTAIVGTSGSGKTTIIKLLLGFIKAKDGALKIGNTPINNVRVQTWRDNCGVVMQDGYIFYDTISQNIAESDLYIDDDKVQKAIKDANLNEFIDGLPLGLNTKIGAKGNGISQGQRQRILISRAIYKNPEFLFFDEATNALDANNETIIMNNLTKFIKGKTAVIVAHRLSTVKNADHIIVLENGELIEEGTHKELIQKKGQYFNLIQNQLELGE